MRVTIIIALLFAHTVCQATTEVRIVTEENKPVQFYENGTLVGFGIDIIESVNLLLSNKSRIELLPWARAYKIALEHRNVLIFSMRRTQDREDLFHWLAPVHPEPFRPDYEKWQTQTNIVFICRKDAKIYIDTIEEAKQYVVASTRGDYLTELIMKEYQWPRTRVQLTQSYRIAVKMMELKRADLAVMISRDYESILHDWGVDERPFRPCFELKKSPALLYFAFSKNTLPEIVDSYTNALKAVYENGTYEKTFNRWYRK